jgi:EAL domain-containing protein (putative c-di-GMP-specific phosphodiesterase class I)
MDVVAEGAETDSDAVELFQLGCEYAQGFVFGEPMSAERARALLEPESGTKHHGSGIRTKVFGS